MFHEKHLQRAVEIQHWIAYHTANIETARRMPITATAWEVEKDVFQFAHIQLQMTEEKLHQILVDGIIADAEKQIADLRDELARMGVAMGEAQPSPASAPRFTIVHATAGEELEAGQPVAFATSPKPIKGSPGKRSSAVVSNMRKVVAGKRR